MDFLASFRNILRDKKQRVGIGIIVFLAVTIPLTIYLVRQQQILKSRALGEGSTFTVVGSQGGFTSGNPPSTTSQFVSLLLNFGSGGGGPPVVPTATTAPGQPTSTPVPSTAPSPTPQSSVPSLTASPATVEANGNVTVSWAGVNATDVYWYIRDQYNIQNYTSLNNCSSSAFSRSSAPVPSSGSCPFTAFFFPALSNPQAGVPYYYNLLHFIPGQGELIVATSNQITVILPTPTPTPIPYATPATPTPVDSDNCGLGQYKCYTETGFVCAFFYETC